MMLREIQFGSLEYDEECRLRQAVLRQPLGLNLYDEDLRSEGGQLHFGMFREDGRLVGCVIAVLLAESKAKIRQMAVESSWQGRGVGRAMLTQVERRLLELGVRRVVLHARSVAIGFYEKLGYCVVGDEFSEVAIPHRMMEKRLSPTSKAGF